ncbi:MAG: lipoprotein-releasing system ATP-binding protein [Acidobacteriaceae bacterium]|jgi:lipoprotein-releasing system ATP-binding protein|nr:lipoprotein-releasing system ATP-binding protein [Acidobacteriaceae bacterium]
MELGAAADEANAGRLGALGSRPGEPVPELGPMLVDVRDLRKVYGKLVLFEAINFRVRRQEMLAIVGQSGAGKSTLLHILGALDTASAGEVYFETTLLRSLTPVEAADFRNCEIGYVWQFHYLLPEFTAAENVALPLLARGESKKEAMQEAIHWLGEVGLAERSTHRAGELSGGEQQRVSIARALITKPKLLLADEPTGDLDNQTAEALFSLLESLHASHGLTSILVTHNMPLARRCDRVLRLAHGRVEEVSAMEV